MLVWNAMPSITPTMSLTRLELAWMSCIEATADWIDCPPCSATWLMRAAICAAASLPCALLRTAELISCTLAEVCSRLDACDSVRSDSARVSSARREPACATIDELLRMSDTISEMRPVIASSDWPTTESSSVPRSWMRVAKSPAASCATEPCSTRTAPNEARKNTSVR